VKLRTVIIHGVLGSLVIYLIMIGALALAFHGWLPVLDEVLSGREVHSFGHYARILTGHYFRGLAFVVALVGLVIAWRAWVRATGGWRRFLPRFAFLLLFTALLFELVLRLAFALPGGRLPALQDAELLGDPNTDDFYWVLAARLERKVARDYVLPVRGWGQKRPTPENPHGLRPDAREALARTGPFIHFYGDSFVHGMPFNRTTLPALLDDRTDAFSVVNLGVRGYGLDQMYLTARELGLPAPGSEVWVGLLTWDLDRAYLSFSYGQKPRYRLEAGRLTLPNVPITRIDQVFVDEFEIPFRSWLLQLLRHHWRSRQGLERGGAEREEKIALNRAILKEWADWCRAGGIPMRIVLFHTRQDLAQESWRTRAVREMCAENDLPLLDTAEVLLPYLKRVGSWGDELFEAGDFHHTDLANELIADWLTQQWIGSIDEGLKAEDGRLRTDD
jgi:hypothetical protein